MRCFTPSPGAGQKPSDDEQRQPGRRGGLTGGGSGDCPVQLVIG